MDILIKHYMYVARCGVFGVTTKFVDADTNEILDTLTQEYPKMTGRRAANNSLRDALDFLHENYEADTVYVESNYFDYFSSSLVDEEGRVCNQIESQKP